jgi:hypothetical protein
LIAAADSFLDALSVFALIGLVAVAGLAVLAFVVELLSKRRDLQHAREGLGHLDATAPEIRTLVQETDEVVPVRDIETFLLAARVTTGSISWDDGYRAASHLEPGYEAMRRMGDRVVDLARQGEFKEKSPGTLQELAKARELLGKTPVAALEYVLSGRKSVLEPRRVAPRKGDPRPEGVGSASHILGYLQRCDALDAAIRAASPAYGDLGPAAEPPSG